MDEKEMVTYEFREYLPNGETVTVEFTEREDGMNCARFHDLCKRYAAALGYSQSVIEKFFGETQYEEMFDL